MTRERVDRHLEKRYPKATIRGLERKKKNISFEERMM